jgi:hypothetical protein
VSGVAESLFTPLGPDRFLPTELSRGPWSPNALHGGPVAILVTRAAETALAHTGSPAHVPVRLTLDLERPVLLAPLTVHADVVRTGGKVQVAEVTVHDDAGTRLVRASVLAIRRTAIDVPPDVIKPEDAPPPLPDAAPVEWSGWVFPDSSTAYHQDATSHQAVRGSLLEPGPVTDWIRLLVPALPGEDVSPFQRVAAAADFGNGISSVLDPAHWLFINPDLTITLHRLPEGEAVAVDAVTRIDRDGTGTAEADLYDVRGRIGRAVQTLLIEPR